MRELLALLWLEGRDPARLACDICGASGADLDYFGVVMREELAGWVACGGCVPPAGYPLRAGEEVFLLGRGKEGLTRLLKSSVPA